MRQHFDKSFPIGSMQCTKSCSTFFTQTQPKFHLLHITRVWIPRHSSPWQGLDEYMSLFATTDYNAIWFDDVFMYKSAPLAFWSSATYNSEVSCPSSAGCFLLSIFKGPPTLNDLFWIIFLNLKSVSFRLQSLRPSIGLVTFALQKLWK